MRDFLAEFVACQLQLPSGREFHVGFFWSFCAGFSGHVKLVLRDKIKIVLGKLIQKLNYTKEMFYIYFFYLHFNMSKKLVNLFECIITIVQ